MPAPKSSRPRVFLAHAEKFRQIRRLADLTRSNLEAVPRKLAVYIARQNIQPDRIIGRVLADEMEKSDLVTVIWTQSAHDSDWVNGELTYARKIGKRVCLLRYEDPPLPEGWEDDRWYVPMKGVQLRVPFANLFGPTIWWPDYRLILDVITRTAREEASKRGWVPDRTP